MTSERCAFLSFVAIAHKLEEAWICFFPVLPLMYISQYLPTIGKRFVDHRLSKGIHILALLWGYFLSFLKKKKICDNRQNFTWIQRMLEVDNGTNFYLEQKSQFMLVVFMGNRNKLKRLNKRKLHNFFSHEFNTWDMIYGIIPKDTLYLPWEGLISHLFFVKLKYSK